VLSASIVCRITLRLFCTQSLDNEVSDVALLFLPLLLGVVGSKSFRAAFWLGSGLMLAANAVVLRLFEEK
jgi:hypothetical protein